MSHGWVIYAWVFLVVQILSAAGRVALFYMKPGTVSRLDLFESGVGLAAMPAVFGFAYGKAYGPHLFWVIFTAGFLVLNVYSFFTPKMRQVYTLGWAKTSATILALVVVGGPALWALVSYAYFDSAVWGR